MIVFDLSCPDGHRFEAWFGSSGAFDAQRKRGLVECPQCGSNVVDKAPMAPAVPVKSNARQTNATRPLTNEMPPEVATAIRALAEAQAMALKSSKWVGGEFAEQSRAMHYGEREHATIHGQATPDEARALADEGVPIAPLPFPVAPPDELN